MKRVIIIIRSVFRLLGYTITSGACLFIVLFYLEHLDISTLRYKFNFLDLYFFVTTAVLPFLRLYYNSWFISTENDSSYRGKALDTYHQEMAHQQKDKKWSSNGVYVNPWEYTTPYTQSYDSSLNWVYSIAKCLFMSILFILFAPVFLMVILFQRFRKKS